jgi:hypothetical protein
VSGGHVHRAAKGERIYSIWRLVRCDRDLDGLRQKREFENLFKLIWSSSVIAKICACADGQISGSSSRVLRLIKRGVSRSSRTLGAGCDGRFDVIDEHV